MVRRRVCVGHRKQKAAFPLCVCGVARHSGVNKESLESTVQLADMWCPDAKMNDLLPGQGGNGK